MANKKQNNNYISSSMEKTCKREIFSPFFIKKNMFFVPIILVIVSLFRVSSNVILYFFLHFYIFLLHLSLLTSIFLNVMIFIQRNQKIKTFLRLNKKHKKQQNFLMNMWRCLLRNDDMTKLFVQKALLNHLIIITHYERTSLLTTPFSVAEFLNIF